MLITSHTQARRPVKFAVSTLTTAVCAAMLMVSPAQADDLEIYQPASTGGGTTLVLMLDAAGNMNSGGKITKLIDGMKIFLAIDDPKVNVVALGLGHYNSKNDTGGDNTTADIIVPARTMGSVQNSTTTFGTFGQYVTGVQLYEPAITSLPSQRRILWDFVVADKSNKTALPNQAGYAFDGNAASNPMQGLAEAASYLLGTTTTDALNSGFSASVSASKNGAVYKTPLTAGTSQCGGVGIYFLTSGSFSPSLKEADGESIFGKALSTPAKPATFNCSSGTGYTYGANTPGLTTDPSPWNCLAGFAKTLYSPTATTNPAAIAIDPKNPVQIKTAFVAFDLVSSSNDALNACHIGYRTGSSDTACPDFATKPNPPGGYGNGGFFPVSEAIGVARSVKNFILTLGADTVTPLVTGAATVPIDDLNPNGFQKYGYLRMIAPNPAKPATMLWKGDLKKYGLYNGAMVSNNSTPTTPIYVLNSSGELNSTASTSVSTTDNWNATAGNGVAAGTDDGGDIVRGGAYPKVPMPYAPITSATGVTPVTKDFTNQNKIRPLFTDLGAVSVVTASTSGTNTYTTTGSITGITADFTDTLSSLSNCTTAQYAAQTCPALTPVKPLTAAKVLATNLNTTIPQMFNVSNTTINNGSPLKNLSIVQKMKLINYLGFNLSIYGLDGNPIVAARTTGTLLFKYTDTTVFPNVPRTVPYQDPVPVPSDLGDPPESPYLSMGGSVHAQPIQLTYSSKVDSSGSLVGVSTDATARVESVLYGTMEGALHLVNATTGVEQMAFVPTEILADDVGSRALKVDSENKSSVLVSDLFTPAQGVDGPWVADPAYTTTKATISTSATLKASRMNVYGGLRLGGSSYYGLDLLTKTDDAVTPKFLFRIGPDVTGYARMGKSWSKPVLANVRYNGVTTRVMIVGGGYDNSSGSDGKGYENPAYVPTTSARALGNAVYMVNAQTGALIWSASYDSAASDGKQYMIHSIPSRVSAIDRDGDQLIDSIYFADLGGQLFRADFNNKYTTSTANFGVRVTRLANLATNAAGTALTNGTNPRFFEAPTVTVYDYGTNTFGLVTLASGNRSAPLDVLDFSAGGRTLRTLPVNKVYGIIDRDLARPDLIKLNTAGTLYVGADGATAYSAVTENLTLNTLRENPQLLTGDIRTNFFPVNTTSKNGWYRSLSSKSDGTEIADGTVRYPGGLKAYEEQIALTGKLYVPVYDPQGTGINSSTCQAHVVGETDLQTYCLPYGACFNTSDGTVNTSAEAKSGAKIPGINNDGAQTSLIGPGIRGISLGADNRTTAPTGSCSAFTLIGNTGAGGSGESWNCTKKLVPTLWYERQPNTAKVQ